MRLQIQLTHTNYKKNGTGWLESNKTTVQITERQYDNIIASSPFFRRLGGIETATKCHTCAGYRVFKIRSTSPDRQTLSIREFEFQYVEPVNP